jgi:GT2 family glycosyltransferase
MSTGAAPVVAAICVTHNSRDLLVSCVTPLRADGVRVVVVDSGSSDGTVDVARALAAEEDVLELPHNGGYAAGINRGLQHLSRTGCDAVVVLNPDVVMTPGSVGRLVAALRPGVGMAAPQLRDEHGRRQLSLRSRPTMGSIWAESLLGGPLAHRLGLPTEVLRDAGAYRTGSTVGWATGGMLALSWSCVAATGAWDESYFLYDEEVDYALRASDAGFAVTYVGDAVAVRAVGAGDAAWAYALMRINRVTLMRRRGGRLAGFLTWLALVLGELLRSVRRSEARGALRCLLWRETPRQVMQRLGPGSTQSSAARSEDRAALSGQVRRSVSG